MSHAAQRAFFERVRQRFPAAFVRVRALDCGSLDVNGSLRELFTGGEYIGVDIREGRGVDVVSKVHDLTFAPGSFETIVSAEMLEHDEFWKQSLTKMFDLLAPRGLLALSMAAPGRMEHGTVRVPDGESIWGSSPDYYRGLHDSDLYSVFDMRRDFSERGIEIGLFDLYFWGIKA